MNPVSSWPVRCENIQVAWGDMDAFKHVNNTVYLRWFESARIAYFDAMRERGVMEVGRRADIGPILAHTSVNFRIPVTFPDIVTAEARVSKIGNSSFTMDYQVSSKHHGGAIAADGVGVVVLVNYETGSKFPLTDAIRDAIAAVESSA